MKKKLQVNHRGREQRPPDLKEKNMNFEIQLGYTYFEVRQAVQYQRLPAETVEDARRLLEDEGVDTRTITITIAR